MTRSRIQTISFDQSAVEAWANEAPEHRNWPIVYLLNDNKSIYVGETTNAELRMKQHLASPVRAGLESACFIIDSTYNKSVCLDLESHLIRYLAADGTFLVLNGNNGITDSDYFDRADYRRTFEEIFSQLQLAGTFTKSIPEIVNSDLFKYSPFKALTPDQSLSIEGILRRFEELDASGSEDPIVVKGDPGTGKTIVAVYLMKLLADIARSVEDETLEADSYFANWYVGSFRDRIREMSIGLVVPQVSLRETIKKVFKGIPGLSPKMVMTPFDVGASKEKFDLLIIDEAHRLQHRSNQAAGSLNKMFRENNIKLFGRDDVSFTQLDWIRSQSKHQIFLVDEAQTVRPNDLPRHTVQSLIESAIGSGDYFQLTSQMRVIGGSDYIRYIDNVLHQRQAEARLEFGDYDLRFFESFTDLRKEILQRDQESGLSRMLAGFAWPWITKGGKSEATHDFSIERIPIRWNSKDKDWINSPGSVGEMGSIHTIQGYDLNYAGVVIGPELTFDPTSKQIRFVRENYHDRKGKENNRLLGIKYSDDDLLEFVLNIYRVLLTRGVRGTYIYVFDQHLRDFLKRYFKVT